MLNSVFTRSTKIFMTVIALVAWFALILQQYIILDNIPENGFTTAGAISHFLSFFTVLSNLLIAIGLTVALLSPRSSAGRFFSRPSVLAATALYIFVVSVVYNFVLRQLWTNPPSGLPKLADELLHVVVPVLYVLFWIIAAPKSSLRWNMIFGWLVYPGLYLVYALIRGKMVGTYAYPFIDLGKLTPARVAINCIGVLALFVVGGLLFIAIGRQLGRAGK